MRGVAIETATKRFMLLELAFYVRGDADDDTRMVKSVFDCIKRLKKADIRKISSRRHFFSVEFRRQTTTNDSRVPASLALAALGKGDEGLNAGFCWAIKELKTKGKSRNYHINFIKQNFMQY